jgi:DNA-directed RNA polymerase sigma subunit (sigma70/sigma32)
MIPGLTTNVRYLDLEPDDSANPARKVAERTSADNIWQYVLQKVKTRQEKVIAEAYLIYDMKPREIYSAHNDAFASVEQVRRTKDNLLARLRRDKHLRELLD